MVVLRIVSMPEGLSPGSTGDAAATVTRAPGNGVARHYHCIQGDAFVLNEDSGPVPRRSCCSGSHLAASDRHAAQIDRATGSDRANVDDTPVGRAVAIDRQARRTRPGDRYVVVDQ